MKSRAWKLEFPKSWVQKDDLTKTVPESWYTHKAGMVAETVPQKLVDPESCHILSQKCARKMGFIIWNFRDIRAQVRTGSKHD